MVVSKRSHNVVKILAGLAVLTAAVTGGVVGASIANMENLGKLDSFNTETAALPTQILDVKGRLITEFFSDEKRELVKLDQLPANLIYALITREDQDFYRHQGFSIRGLLRAGWNILTGSYVSGGSTLTQQLATSIYLDKSELSMTRKLKELWYSIQLEHNWSKEEILEEYLNKMPFGHNTHGVEAASQFFFGHPAKDMTPAESAMLVLQVSSPGGLYSPLRHPDKAKDRQKEILSQMVELGYISVGEADKAFKDYWDNFDYTRSPSETAFVNRVDLAPFFSEYVRGQLENEYLLGNADIYRDGYRVYTTLDLDKQKIADDLMVQGIAEANKTYRKNMDSRSQSGADTFVPLADLLSLSFNIPDMRVGGEKQLTSARLNYLAELQPFLDLVSTQFAHEGDKNLRTSIDAGYALSRDIAKQNTVQGALISIDNDTGHILAMVGGSQFESSNQFNRATMSRVQPGSTFKPLYYAAGIERGVITPATRINDTQIVFTDEDGKPYRPLNYKGEFKGPVLVRQALAHSMNIPSIRVLNMVGFDDAINISSRLLGIPQSELANRNFQRKFPLALGIISVSPMEMAKAFAVFPNLGRQVEPVAIRYIEDRRGNIVSEPEKEIREELGSRGYAAQIVSPQTAYIMTDLLQSVVREGTLSYPASLAGGFTMPMAGKTGTPQNWSAAWTVGFSPYMTTAVWLGIDEGNNSLGTNQTGSSLAGPLWARYMKKAHEELPPRNFNRPDSGISWVRVTSNSGLLPPPDFTGDTRNEIFKSGTEPKIFDTMEAYDKDRTQRVVDKMSQSLGTSLDNTDYQLPDDGSGDFQLNINDSVLNFDTSTFTVKDDSTSPPEASKAPPGTAAPYRTPEPLGNSLLD